MVTSLQCIVRDKECVRSIARTIGLKIRKLACNSRPVDLRETKPSGLTDRPEVPCKEQQKYGKQRTHSAEWLQTAIAEVEARIAMVIAAQIVASADGYPKRNSEQQGKG